MPNINPSKKSFLQKRIPTLIGLGVLIVSLVAGTFLFSQGTGVFAPRATPQTTPQKIRVTNVTDSGFTVSFLTDEKTVAHIKYGTDQKKMSSQASDDRDQLSGAIGKYNAHHVTVRGLEPNTTFYYVLGTGSGSFDNNGQPFTIKTTQRSGVPSAAKTIYGSVVTPEGNPAEGAIVYVKAQGVGEVSSLVKSSGSWAIPLSNARLEDGSAYAQIQDTDALTLFIQGLSSALTSEVTVMVADAQPVANLTLGQAQADQVAAADPVAPGEATPPANNPNDSMPPTMDEQLPPIDEALPPANGLTDAPAILDQTATSAANPASPGGLANMIAETDQVAAAAASAAAALTTVNLEQLAMSEASSTSATVQTSQPKITGKAVPNVTISIQVHSDTNIDQYIVADAAGNFELDISQLGEELEPGEHTVTYSYEDPSTGETVTKTQTFYVADTSNELALADTTSANSESSTATNSGAKYPYSSANPYPVDASGSGETTHSGTATKSATTSALPVSGSVGTTYALILGGLFFIFAGAWSWWIANNLEEVEVEG